MPEKNAARKRINDDTPVGLEYSKDIPCKTCVFKLSPVGDFERYTNGYCEIYDSKTSGKPNEILFNNANCKYYMKEDE